MVNDFHSVRHKLDIPDDVDPQPAGACNIIIRDESWGRYAEPVGDFIAYLLYKGGWPNDGAV